MSSSGLTLTTPPPNVYVDQCLLYLFCSLADLLFLSIYGPFCLSLSLLHCLVQSISAYPYLCISGLICLSHCWILWVEGWCFGIYAMVNIPTPGFPATRRLNVKILLDCASSEDPKKCDNKTETFLKTWLNLYLQVLISGFYANN